jgi:hypothetical protein
MRRSEKALEHAWSLYWREGAAESWLSVRCDTPHRETACSSTLARKPAVWQGFPSSRADYRHVPILRWVAFILVASAFFAIALSDIVYELTSPYALSWHVLLRKTYSIGAFTIVGTLLQWALPARVRGPFQAAGAIAVYSGLIEIAQWLAGGREGLMWNAIDVACGALGGSLGYVGLKALSSARALLRD